MKEIYKTVRQEASAEIIEKRSRFIATVRPVTSEGDAVEFINSLRQKYWDATHNVYAYIIEDNNVMRYTDDGEPSGTAGIPVLDILKKNGLTNTVIVVTRYFGGTLLGTGGLVHAYSKSAKQGIAAAGVVEMVLCRKTTLRFSYPLLGKIQSELFSRSLIQDEPIYTDVVEIPVYVPTAEFDKFRSDMIESSNAAVTFSDGRRMYKERPLRRDA